MALCLHTLSLAFAAVCLLSISACADKPSDELNVGLVREEFDLPFSINNPDRIHALDRALDEISGLTWSTDGFIHAVHDEKDKLFVLSPGDGSITADYNLKKKRDYEGLTNCLGSTYIVESDGDLRRLSGTLTDEEEFGTRLRKENDLEGACCLREDSLVLLVGKGLAAGLSDSKTKAVYAFDPASNQLKEGVHIQLDLAGQLKELPPRNLASNFLVNLSVKERLSSFGPSAIDVDPLTGDLYVLSSRGRLLTVWIAGGHLKAIYFLRSAFYGQPEGMCFDPDGNLFISNEARNRPATLLFFERKILVDGESEESLTN